MNLHEYQAKQLFRQQGIAVPEGRLLQQAEQLPQAANELGGGRWVLKAQVHAGGRGKGGGVLVSSSLEELEAGARRILAQPLVTPQTGPEGLPVSALLLEPACAIQRELYLGLLLDRAAERLLVMASAAGGMSIEEVAAHTPEQIHSLHIDPVVGVQPYQGRELAFALGLEGDQIKQFGQMLSRLYALFVAEDASLVEINPLVVTQSGDLLALDAKINLDDNAAFRHPQRAQWRDLSQEDAREAQAAEHELNYISLDGNIGCMVNGAGLAMATMDLVKLHGGLPANFLDVGGGTTAARVAEAFKLILSDSQVKAVLVNIFGGIVRCDLIAEGIISAIKEVGIEIPVVVRLEGTRAAEGLAMLNASGLALETASDLTQAAQRVVAAAGGAA
jgi:succinyl-CoA synthetase beta subunit